MKRKKAINFLTVTLFAGILLSFMIYVGAGTVFDSDDGDGKKKTFNDIFYTDNAILSFVRYFDYKVFNHIEDGDYIIGADDWLFEAVDSENGYERLLDYIGGNGFDEKQLDTVTEIIKNRAELYESQGVQYMMVVIPDSMTVCEKNVPEYLGRQSENTRLSMVTSRLAGEQVDEFINPTEIMKTESGEIAMYNNTENSINAYGAYCIYNTVVSRFMADTGMEVERLHRDDLEFYTRLTDGRTIARNAGIQSIVKNRTVSISDSFPENYVTVSEAGGVTVTEHTQAQTNNTEYYVVVECTNSWDRLQLMPYFSNTFDKVSYRDMLFSDAYGAAKDKATLVVQIIRESELSSILG